MFKFLAYAVDPYAIREPVAMWSSIDGPVRKVSIHAIAQSRELVFTYDASRLIDYLREGRCGRPTIVDLEDALRLRSGLSRSQGGQLQWDVWKALIGNSSKVESIEAVRDFNEGRSQTATESELSDALRATVIAMRSLWAVIESDLKKYGEHDRFCEIEIPVQHLFLARQYRGIGVDLHEVQRLIEECRAEKYTAFRQIASMIGFSPSGLSFRTVSKFLGGTDASHLTEFADSPNLQEYFKVAAPASRFASLFLQYVRASRNLTVLTRLNSGAERVFPVFRCSGTVTSRIHVVDPRLQELRRGYRSILVSDPGNSLLYLDYGQFEPGIFSYLSGDHELQKQYASTDLYESLSMAIFGDDAHRSICKRIFLAYCYGMTSENIAKLLAGHDAHLVRLKEFKDLVVAFFSAFPSLITYKSSLEEQLIRDGQIGTLFGNHRVRTSKGGLTYKEKRWALSQVVQGTASLIFKTALLSLAKEFGPDSILLPMHDAVLMQLPTNDNLQCNQERAAQLMSDAFLRWCPGMRPKVIQSSFVPTVFGNAH